MAKGDWHHMCGFNGIERGNYFEGKTIRSEVKVRLGNFKKMERLQVRMRSMEITWW